MPVVKCADCGGTVGLSAATCPHCGAPGPTAGPIPIELTAKRWKAVMLAGAVAAVAGWAGFILSIGRGSAVWVGMGIAVGLLGTSIAVAGRVAAWWHHG